MDQKSRILDPVSEQPIERPAPLATRPAQLEEGRLDILDPAEPDERMVQVLEKRAEVRTRVIQLALQQTSPSQYVIHRAEGDEARESVYPMGAAADAMFGFLGFSWAAAIPILDGAGKEIGWRRGDVKWHSKVLKVGEPGEEKRYYWVRSALWSRDVLMFLGEGKRLIGSGYAKDEPTAEIDAFENLKSRAVREVLGLKGKDRAWYKEQGLDLSNARLAEFQDRKGVTSSDPQEATLPFGKEKGVKVCDATDETLTWILPKIRESVADPKKARFRGPNEALATAIQAELDRRAAKPTLDAQQAEELEQLIVQVREEANDVAPEKLEPYIAGLDTIEKAQKALAFYRARRAKKSKGGTPPEPGSQG